jgi:hypothetical protein
LVVAVVAITALVIQEVLVVVRVHFLHLMLLEQQDKETKGVLVGLPVLHIQTVVVVVEVRLAAITAEILLAPEALD